MAIAFDAVPGQSAWLLLLNADAQAVDFQLPAGNWRLCLATDPAQDPDDGIPMALDPAVQVAGSSLWIART